MLYKVKNIKMKYEMIKNLTLRGVVTSKDLDNYLELGYITTKEFNVLLDYTGGVRVTGGYLTMDEVHPDYYSNQVYMPSSKYADRLGYVHFTKLDK